MHYSPVGEVSRKERGSNFVGSCSIMSQKVLSAAKSTSFINPLRPNNYLSQTSPCNIKGLSAGEVLRIENMITQMKFY